MNHANHGATEFVTDPVCGMQIDPASSAGTLEWQGQKVHFCSPRCASRFRAETEKYPLVRSAQEPRSGQYGCCG